MKSDPTTGAGRGFCFAQFRLHSCAANAIRTLNGTSLLHTFYIIMIQYIIVFRGRVLRLGWAERESDAPGARALPPRLQRIHPSGHSITPSESFRQGYGSLPSLTPPLTQSSPALLTPLPTVGIGVAPLAGAVEMFAASPLLWAGIQSPMPGMYTFFALSRCEPNFLLPIRNPNSSYLPCSLGTQGADFQVQAILALQ